MIGILGDGQLSLMLVESALAQGQDVIVAGEDKDSPVARSYPELYVGDDYASFFSQARIVTLENEFYTPAQLKVWQKKYGFEIIPDIASYELLSTKYKQSQFFESLNIAIPKTLPIASHWNHTNEQEIITWAKEHFTFPVVVKKSYGGYDGYGTAIAKDAESLMSVLHKFGLENQQEILLQEFVDLECECAQSILLDGKGHAVELPLVKTFQQDGICHLVSTNHQLKEATTNQIKAILSKMKQTSLKGLFAFEFFITKNGQVLINEAAPRPHNSQHITNDACDKSQFDYLIDLCAYRPIKDETVEVKPSIMINLLGKTVGHKYKLTLPPISSDYLIYPKLYNKKHSRVGRKMGHLNILANNTKASEELILLGERIFRDYQL